MRGVNRAIRSHLATLSARLARAREQGSRPQMTCECESCCLVLLKISLSPQCDGQNSWGQNMCVYCDGDEDNIHGRVCQDEYAVTDSGYSE